MQENFTYIVMYICMCGLSPYLIRQCATSVNNTEYWLSEYPENVVCAIVLIFLSRGTR